MSEPIPVTVIGGYLGAGKTTLVNHILSSASDRTAVLVNDFGSVSIDDDLVIASDEDTITLANGCICCSLIDGFGAALDALVARKDPPKRLIIEASGVSEPSQVAAYAQMPGLKLDSIIVLADAETIMAQAKDRYVGDVVLQQLLSADLIVLNKIDLVTETRLDALSNWLSETSPAASIAKTCHSQLPLSLLTDLSSSLLSGTRPLANKTSVAADGPSTRFDEWGITSAHPLDRDLFIRMLGALPTGVLRLKAIVRFEETPNVKSVVQRVGQRQTITETGPWPGGQCRLAAIGQADAIDATWLETQLGLTSDRSPGQDDLANPQNK